MGDCGKVGDLWEDARGYPVLGTAAAKMELLQDTAGPISHACDASANKFEKDQIKVWQQD